MLTANAPATHDNSKPSLANLLDTLAFYGAVSLPDMLPRLRALSNEENGPTVISALPGDYSSPQLARRSASVAKVALAAGVTAISMSDFAPGQDQNSLYSAHHLVALGIIDPAGGRSAGYEEMHLLGDAVRLFGPELTKAVAADGVAKVDDPEVHVAVRLGEKAGFIFLGNPKDGAARQVRLTYAPPGTTATVSIPEAGAISLPAGCAKMLALEVPVSRGLVRYSTSEIAAIQQVGDRTVLVVYGDPDTPGEIALRWPGPPLVSGKVQRQRWDSEKNLLILDYFHTQEDHSLVVDDLEIVILSRQRAAWAGAIAGLPGAITLSAGAEIAAGSLTGTQAEVALDFPAGSVQVTAALPQAPSSVTIDGAPLEVQFTAPSRVMTCTVTTAPFEEERRPTGLGRLQHVILGGPPKLSADFDRSWFLSDASARAGACQSAASLGISPELVGLIPGTFARLAPASRPRQGPTFGSLAPSIPRWC